MISQLGSGGHVNKERLFWGPKKGENYSNVVTQVPDDNTHDHDMTSEIGSQESLLAKNNVKLNIHPGRKIGL